MTTLKIGKTKSISSIVNSFILYSFQTEDERYYAQYLRFAQDVYRDLNFNILSSEIRSIVPVDKKLAVVRLPDDLLYWRQISVIDDLGNTIPLLENNDNIKGIDEITVVPACENPKCESDLCASVKAITAIQDTVTIGDRDYINITKTQKQGSTIIKETCKWYSDGKEVSDYSVHVSNSNTNTVVHVTINSVDYPIGITCDLTSQIQDALNLLKLGVFSCDGGSGELIITTLANPNDVHSITVNGMIIATTNFTKTNTHLNAINVCTTEQICDIDITEDGCIKDTPENVTVLAECCVCGFSVVPCKPKKLLPTIKVDVPNQIVYLSNLNYDQVVLTYKTSGINFGQELLVPEMADFVMISGISYFAVKHNKRASVSEKENARKLYDLDKRKFVKMFNPLRIQELENAARIKNVIY